MRGGAITACRAVPEGAEAVRGMRGGIGGATAYGLRMAWFRAISMVSVLMRSPSWDQDNGVRWELVVTNVLCRGAARVCEAAVMGVMGKHEFRA